MADAEILKHRTRFLPYGCAVTDHEALAFAHALIAATREQVIEECAKVCDQIETAANKWMVDHPNDLGDAFKHQDGVLDGVASCAERIRALTRPPGD